eukprot:UN27253
MSCPICLSDFYENEEIARTSCNHEFHIKCIKHWHETQRNNNVAMTCPYCFQSMLQMYQQNRKAKCASHVFMFAYSLGITIGLFCFSWCIFGDIPSPLGCIVNFFGFEIIWDGFGNARSLARWLFESNELKIKKNTCIFPTPLCLNES